MTERSLVYAEAMFELAVEQNRLESIWQELSAISGILQENPRLISLLSCPSVARDERKGIVDTVFDSADASIRNFFKLLIDRSIIAGILPCIEQFYRLYCKEMNIELATAVTAVPLGDAEKQALTDRLERALGKKVELKTRVDSSLIGGIRLQLSDKELESSISSRLQGLARHIGT